MMTSVALLPAVASALRAVALRTVALRAETLRADALSAAAAAFGIFGGFQIMDFDVFLVFHN
jgi:hypothetical protein